MTDEIKKTEKEAEMEVSIIRDYWPMGNVDVMRGDRIVSVGADHLGKSGDFDDRLRTGDVVSLPRKEASKLVNAGAAKLPEMD
jgi:hypothetical protein